jgi:C1A family cysteine protease
VKYSFSIGATANTFMGLIADRKCIILGIYVYSSFMNRSTLKTGIVPMPNRQRETLLGGHCICLTGYDSITQRFSFKNSWGSRVGNKGTFTIPFSYVCNYTMSGDAWSF